MQCVFSFFSEEILKYQKPNQKQSEAVKKWIEQSKKIAIESVKTLQTNP